MKINDGTRNKILKKNINLKMQFLPQWTYVVEIVIYWVSFILGSEWKVESVKYPNLRIGTDEFINFMFASLMHKPLLNYRWFMKCLYYNY